MDMEKNGIKPDRLEQAYRPSWYDRLSARIDRGRLPSWLAYLLIPIMWILITMLVQWLEGSGTLRDWEPISFVAIAQIGYILFICQFMDKQALKALEEFKPALAVGEDDFPRLQRLISTLPARKTLIATLLFGVIGIFLIFVSIAGNLDSAVAPDPNFFGVTVAITMLALWLANGLFAYHTFHQLGVVNYIYTNQTIVHPFHQRELFAFSNFAAQTGIAVVIVTPLWIILDPGIVSLIISIIFGIFGLIAFFTPLIGVHNILSREKDQLLDENARHMETAIEELMRTIDTDQLEHIKLEDQKISSLEKARLQIDRISTWPWRIETLRRVLAAIILPIIIWLLQYFLAKALA
jgi:hypothetical protein